MKIISPAIHGVLDYVTVVIFALAPQVLGLTGVAGVICYTLAAVHLIMTLITVFPAGAVQCKRGRATITN